MMSPNKLFRDAIFRDTNPKPYFNMDGQIAGGQERDYRVLSRQHPFDKANVPDSRFKQSLGIRDRDPGSLFGPPLSNPLND